MKACGELTSRIDPPVPCRIICWAAAPKQVEGPPHGDVDCAAESFQVGLVEQFALTVRGVADGNVHLAEFLSGTCDHPFDGGGVRHIGLVLDSTRTGVPDGLEDLVCSLFMGAEIDDDVCAARPSATAVARPIPKLAPVTMATRPLSSRSAMTAKTPKTEAEP